MTSFVGDREGELVVGLCVVGDVVEGEKVGAIDGELVVGLTVVGDMVEAKHYRGGWHYCTIVGKVESQDGDIYQVVFRLCVLVQQCA